MAPGRAERLGSVRRGSVQPEQHEPLQGVQIPTHRGPAAPQGGERRGTLLAVRYRGGGCGGAGVQAVRGRTSTAVAMGRPRGAGGATPALRGVGSRCCGPAGTTGPCPAPPPGARPWCGSVARAAPPWHPLLPAPASAEVSSHGVFCSRVLVGNPSPPGAVQPVPLAWGTGPVSAGSRAVPRLP